jgi:4-amino-4-deoxy-L-arabinose transferase-like glycosyltransferase
MTITASRRRNNFDLIALVRSRVDNRLLPSVLIRRLALWLGICLICALYLADLTGMGMYGPDEPRYADVGRAMAQSGDWITPRLWGQPWFEKPALLYWMTATGFRLGLGPDLAPRLPVAVLSVLFLAFFWWRLSVEWDRRAASYTTAMLATSAGWLMYSHVAVADLPLAVFFSAAVLLSMPWLARGDEGLCLTAAAACLGLATMAKGLVPLVLFLPVMAMGWRRLRDWLRSGPLLAFSICALPWYILCTIRNGSEFPRVFFVEQQFERFGSASLQHVQPVWFYIPVLLVLLYPWFPLLVALPAGIRHDPRLRALVAVVLFGFVFFSAAVNKLPGYLIPLLPASFVLLGLGLSRAQRPALAVSASVILLGALAPMSGIVPRVLASHGSWSGNIAWVQVLIWLGAAGVAAVVLARFGPQRVFGAGAVLAGIGFLWFQFATFPGLDAAASARPLWLADHPQCAPDVSRDILYGLYYYAQRRISPCTVLDQSGTRVVR